MKTLILAAFAALSLTAGVVQSAHAASFSRSPSYHSGPYDNTGASAGNYDGLEGGGG